MKLHDCVVHRLGVSASNLEAINSSTSRTVWCLPVLSFLDHW